VELAVAHELIHAYDFCRASNLDLTNCHHHACTEVRMAEPRVARQVITHSKLDSSKCCRFLVTKCQTWTSQTATTTPG
jgi:hypothetical protein